MAACKPFGVHLRYPEGLPIPSNRRQLYQQSSHVAGSSLFYDLVKSGRGDHQIAFAFELFRKLDGPYQNRCYREFFHLWL